MNYIDVYKKRAAFLGRTPQERAFESGKLEFARYLKYRSSSKFGLLCEEKNLAFDGVILSDKEDENRVSQILLTSLEVPLSTGDLITWDENKWLIYRVSISAYQPYQKFYMVKCNYYINWIDKNSGALKGSWVYLLGSKDSKIQDNFRTWNEMITPQPNKHINIIMPHQLMANGTEIIILDEVWYLVDYDQNSVPNIIFLSFTETNVNEQRDDLNAKIANIDKKANWTIEASKSQTVLPGAMIVLDYNIYKNGIKQNIVPNITVSDNLILKEDGTIYAGATGAGVITFSYEDAIFEQEIVVGGTENIKPILSGNNKVRVTQQATYVYENAGETVFTISDESLATITSNGNTCILTANSNNKIGEVELKAVYNKESSSKTIQIVSLWQVI